MKLRTTLLSLITVFGISTAQAGFLEEFVTFQDRVIPLPLESYQQVRDQLLQSETYLQSKLVEERDTQTSLKQFCELLDIKFERIALAAANLKYDQAYADFNKLKTEIEDEAQSNYGIRHTCYAE